MQFNDTIKVQALVYSGMYAKVGDSYFHLNDDGSVADKASDNEVEYLKGSILYDENGNEVVPKKIWLVFGKEKNAIISPNSRANKVSLNDGKDFVYSYEVIVKLKKQYYPFIPKEGSRVWLHKADGTIDKDMEVKGFVTLKQRYLKLWL